MRSSRAVGKSARYSSKAYLRSERVTSFRVRLDEGLSLRRTVSILPALLLGVIRTDGRRRVKQKQPADLSAGLPTPHPDNVVYSHSIIYPSPRGRGYRERSERGVRAPSSPITVSFVTTQRLVSL